MIKELFWLIKVLFTKIQYGNVVTYKHMKYFPFKGFSAMSWCGYLLSRKPYSEISVSTTIHESIHLKLALIKGSWIKYYWSYFIEWLKGNYYTIPYEMEAYANCTWNYITNYDGNNLDKYKLKNRRKIYKLNKSNWINFIKRL